MKTWKNKLIAIVLLVGGMLCTLIDGDATGSVFCAILAVPIFFAKENWIE